MKLDDPVGKHCKLLKAIRDHEGTSHYSEHPKIIKAIENLGRIMYLVEFSNGSSTFVFPDEVAIDE